MLIIISQYIFIFFSASSISPSFVFVLVVAILGFWLGLTYLVYDRRTFVLRTWARLR